MKRIFLIIITTFIAVTLNAQNEAANDSINSELYKSMLVLKYATNHNPKFELYKTENMWTFLELDTSDGRVWQVQYSVEGSEYRFRTSLNSESLLEEGDAGTPGRLQLYPTQNTYNFLLIDHDTGSVWQVQWSQTPENRMIIPIYGY